jgi:hypothetical protein
MSESDHQSAHAQALILQTRDLCSRLARTQQDSARCGTRFQVSGFLGLESFNRFMLPLLLGICTNEFPVNWTRMKDFFFKYAFIEFIAVQLFVSLVVLGFELRISHLLDRRSVT